jgi:hypothetical protein
MPFDQAPDGVAAKRGTPRSGEDRVVVGSAPLGKIDSHNGDGLAGERRGPVLSSLPPATDMRAGAEVDVSQPQSDELGDPEPGLRSDDEQGMVTPAVEARPVRAGQ